MWSLKNPNWPNSTICDFNIYPDDYYLVRHSIGGIHVNLPPEVSKFCIKIAACREMTRTVLRRSRAGDGDCANMAESKVSTFEEELLSSLFICKYPCPLIITNCINRDWNMFRLLIKLKIHLINSIPFTSFIKLFHLITKLVIHHQY